jgi:hypothetical protein
LVTDTEFIATGSAPVRIAAENMDALAGDNTYTSGSPNVISVYGDVTRSLTWPNEGVPYYPDNTTMTVYNSATLTLAPGVTRDRGEYLQAFCPFTTALRSRWRPGSPSAWNTQTGS